jgi:hypothetical protein
LGVDFFHVKPLFLRDHFRYYIEVTFPIKVCVVCGEEFEWRPDKPGYANRCWMCSSPDAEEPEADNSASFEERRAEEEMNAARRRAIRDMLYRKES